MNALQGLPEFKELKDQIYVEMSGEGLRIELLELASSDSSDSHSFFKLGSTKLNERVIPVMSTIAKELGHLPNHIIIEGHTDSRQYPEGAQYTNWELSTDRANAARQLMESQGIRSDQILGVRGFADKKPRLPSNPMDPRNRRISIIVLNTNFEKKYKEIEGITTLEKEL
jgi:chemotaxis protein MotB